MPVESRDRGRVDDHAPLAGRVGLALGHRGRRHRNHVERADQVDVDHPRERFEPMRPFFAHSPLGQRDAGAIDQTVQSAEFLDGRLDARSADARLVTSVSTKRTLGPNSAASASPGPFLHVGNHRPAAAGDKPPHAGRSQSRSAAGNQERVIGDLHDGRSVGLNDRARVWESSRAPPAPSPSPARERGEGLQDANAGGTAQIRSMIVAVAMPWPMHITCKPVFPPVVSRPMSILDIRPAPVAPSGWP